MTTEVLTPTPSYTISGTGPYAIEHGYSAAAGITAAVVLDGVRTDLVYATDYTVSPDGDPDGGDLTLSAGAATSYDGGTLYITRDTSIEQGWEGIAGPREKGLERQLDRQAQAMQDAKLNSLRSIRVDYPLDPIALVPGTVLTVDDDGQIVALDVAALATLTPEFGPLQDYIDAQLVAVNAALTGKQALAGNLTALAALSITANKVIYGTGAGTIALADQSPLARTLAALTTEASVRTQLSLYSQAQLDARLAEAGNEIARADTSSGGTMSNDYGFASVVAAGGGSGTYRYIYTFSTPQPDLKYSPKPFCSADVQRPGGVLSGSKTTAGFEVVFHNGSNDRVQIPHEVSVSRKGV